MKDRAYRPYRMLSQIIFVVTVYVCVLGLSAVLLATVLTACCECRSCLAKYSNCIVIPNVVQSFRYFTMPRFCIYHCLNKDSGSNLLLPTT